MTSFEYPLRKTLNYQNDHRNMIRDLEREVERIKKFQSHGIPTYLDYSVIEKFLAKNPLRMKLDFTVFDGLGLTLPKTKTPVILFGTGLFPPPLFMGLAYLTMTGVDDGGKERFAWFKGEGDGDRMIKELELGDIWVEFPGFALDVLTLTEREIKAVAPDLENVPG
jgi:hypothetical protein